MTDQIFHNAKKLHWNKPNNELTRDFANFKHIISATKINKLKQQQKKTLPKHEQKQMNAWEAWLLKNRQ